MAVTLSIEDSDEIILRSDHRYYGVDRLSWNMPRLVVSVEISYNLVIVTNTDIIMHSHIQSLDHELNTKT